MTAGQRHAAQGLLTSGVGLDLVVGVAGSGKTTALAAVRRRVRDGRLRGDRHAPPAARPPEAWARGPGSASRARSRRCAGASTTTRSPSTDRHVIILDETGMTDDVDLGRLLAAADAAGAKVIVVGRRPPTRRRRPRRRPRRAPRPPPRAGVDASTDNVRQLDPGERSALAELRAGDVEPAVAWYARNRPHHAGPRPRRRPSTAWSTAGPPTSSPGRDAVLLRLAARQRRRAQPRRPATPGPPLGRLSRPRARSARRAPLRRRRPDRHPRPRPDGRLGHLRAGHRHRRRPRPTAQLIAPSPPTGAPAPRRRRHRRGPPRLRVRHHRPSRPRRHRRHRPRPRGRRRPRTRLCGHEPRPTASHVYVAAPDPAEAAERLAGPGWAAERRPTLGARPGTSRSDPTRPNPNPTRSSRWAPPSTSEYDLQQLRRGTPRPTRQPAGAALTLTHAKANYRRAARRASHPALRRRERGADRDLGAARQTLEAARADWETYGQPHASRLETLIADADLAVRHTLDTHRAQQAQRPSSVAPPAAGPTRSRPPCVRTTTWASADHAAHAPGRDSLSHSGRRITEVPISHHRLSRGSGRGSRWERCPVGGNRSPNPARWTRGSGRASA